MFKISWPEQLTKIITSLMGSSLDDMSFAKLGASVLRVSDLFLEGAGTKESKTPWSDTDLRRAYLSYFFPLNTLRVMRVLDEAKNRGFLEGIDHVIDVVIKKLRTAGEREVPSDQMGAWVMAELKNVDQVAYVRFASVYRRFEDVQAFREAVEQLERDLPKEFRDRQLSLLDDVPPTSGEKR